MKKLLVLALWAMLSVAEAQDGTFRFYGYAYDLKSNKYLYTETHQQKSVNGKWVGGSITYTLPDGSPLAAKTLDFSQDAFVPVYRLDVSKSGYMEAITDSKGPIVMQRRDATGKKLETESVKKAGLMAADSGFHSFLVEHFDSLMAGKPVNFRFVVTGNLDTFKFRATRTQDTVFEGKPAVRFLVEVDSLLSLLAAPLEVTYDPKSKKLLEYRGLSNIHDPATGEAYKAVRIAYYSTPPADAPKLPPLN